MEHNTVGKKYNIGKVVDVECKKNLPLEYIDTKDNYFLLIVLLGGTMHFSVDGRDFVADAPCFVCFNELQCPVLVSKYKADYFGIYFRPQYLNMHMNFEVIRSQEYDKVAIDHDMFLLKPFIDGCNYIPICGEYKQPVRFACENMSTELDEQQDWYWSCRGRSYFMEIIIELERMYGLAGLREPDFPSYTETALSATKLHDAVLFIEAHFSQSITLTDISRGIHLNHTTLTSLFKKEYGMTAVEYLMEYRVSVAKKQIGLTNMPFKDIANRCGFKTVQHFSRVFKDKTGYTPAGYRTAVFQKRDAQFMAM